MTETMQMPPTRQIPSVTDASPPLAAAPGVVRWLLPDDTGHRRVLAVLQFLRSE